MKRFYNTAARVASAVNGTKLSCGKYWGKILLTRLIVTFFTGRNKRGFAQRFAHKTRAEAAQQTNVRHTNTKYKTNVK
jgi:hypothetical protein